MNPQTGFLYFALDCCAWAGPQAFEKVQISCVERVIAGIGSHAAMSEQVSFDRWLVMGGWGVEEEGEEQREGEEGEGEEGEGEEGG